MRKPLSILLLVCLPADAAFSDEGEEEEGGGVAELATAADLAALPSDMSSLSELLAELPW
jgi:hypothetical protein